MKGIYILLISLKTNIKADVGSLGMINFKKGTYAYIGSAQNNIEKRIERHLRKNKRLFWHIDYLLNNKNTKINEILIKKSGKSGECRTAKNLAKIGKPVIGFGCSDCNCKSHLIKIKKIKIGGFNDKTKDYI